MAAGDKLSATEQALQDARNSLDEGFFPLEFFHDEDLHDLEMERIIGQSWVFIGHESEIPEPGDYARRYIGDDTFIFVRDESGEVNLLFDSCRHRGAQVCRAEQGNTSHFRCPYHGWTYKNDGEAAGIPQKSKAFKNLDRSEYGLAHVPRLESYEGLVFASLAEEGPSLDEWLGDFKWYFDVHMKLPEGGMEVIGEPHRWVVDANWKTIADNFNGDSYHTAWAHGSVLDLELGGEETVGHAGTGDSLDRHIHCDGHTTSMRGFEGEDVFLTYPDEVVEDLFTREGLSDAQWQLARQALSFTGAIFPNFGFLHFGDTTDDPEKDVAPFFTIRKWRPLGPDQMELWSWGLAPKNAPEEFKQRMYKMYTANFGPTGNFEQDDVPIWKGITDSASGQFASSQNLQLNYQMGLEWMSEMDIDEEWLGPGFAYSENLEEGGMRLFHEQWYEMLAGNDRTDATGTPINLQEDR